MLKRIKINSWGFASSCCCAAVAKTPARSFACTYDRASRSPEPTYLRYYTGRRQVRFFGKRSSHDCVTTRLPSIFRGATSLRHLRWPNRSPLPPLIDDHDSDQDNLSFAFGNLSITLSSTNCSSRYYSCDLVLLFFLIYMFNMFSVRVVLTLVAMIYDISLNLVSLQHMLNLAVHFVMI
jgi:hypothetical protein